jgi:hypothetical protein
MLDMLGQLERRAEVMGQLELRAEAEEQAI